MSRIADPDMEDTDADRPLEQLACPLCGEYLEPSSSKQWATCPKLHGKLMQQMSPQEIELVEIARLPKTGQRVMLGKFDVVRIERERPEGFPINLNATQNLMYDLFTARKKATPGHILLKCRLKKLPRQFCRIGDQAFELLKPIKLKKNARGKWVRDSRK
jgi:hypothetical protein